MIYRFHGANQAPFPTHYAWKAWVWATSHVPCTCQPAHVDPLYQAFIFHRLHGQARRPRRPIAVLHPDACCTIFAFYLLFNLDIRYIGGGQLLAQEQKTKTKEEFIEEMENPGAPVSKPLTSKNNASRFQALLIWCIGTVARAEQPRFRFSRGRTTLWCAVYIIW